jgi:hypothetical protein
MTFRVETTAEAERDADTILDSLTGCCRSTPETLASGGFWHCRTPSHPLRNFRSGARWPPRVPYSPLKYAICSMATYPTFIGFCSQLRATLFTYCISVTAAVDRSSTSQNRSRVQKYPVTDDWVLVSDFWRDHAKAMSAGLVARPVD